MIRRIATAECFTHGRVAGEIHAFSRGYPSRYLRTLDPKTCRLSIVAGLFIPTLSGVRSILQVEPLRPVTVIDEIKIYDQYGDEEMALLMAEAARTLTGADIGIGTSAGIGQGGIAVVSDGSTLSGSSEIYADLRRSDRALIREREESGVTVALCLLERLLEEEDGGKPANHA